MRTSLILRLSPLAVVGMPLLVQAQAQAVAQIVGVFNVFVGLMLTVALITYATGFAMWWIRLGTWPSYRTEAVRIMEWAVMILFTLVVLLGIVQFFQGHPHEATYVISAVVIALIIWAVLYLAAHSGGGGEKEH